MIKKLFKEIMEIGDNINQDHVGAYAAQAAYFFMLSLIPIILLLLTMVQYTPVTKADVMTAVMQVFPQTITSFITSIVNQVYNQSTSVIPVTIIVALWSAGKGVMSISNGLNEIFGCRETRNYVLLRLRATMYTVMFVAVIISLLVLSVFGDSLSVLLIRHVPAIKPVITRMMGMRTILTPVVIIIFMLIMYKVLPNRKDYYRKQLPGALFTAVGWLVVSWIFSKYLDIFRGFSTMYGSLTTIVLIMLWLYFVMYCILLGAEANVYFYDKIFTSVSDHIEILGEEQK